MMTDNELKARIRTILKQDYPASLTELGRLMGYRKISGRLTRRIRRLIPGLPEFLTGNKIIKELEE